MWCLNVVLFLKMIIRKSKLLLFQWIDLYWSFTVINKLLYNHKKSFLFFLIFTRKWDTIVLSKETRVRFLGEYLLFIKRHLKKRFRDFYETIPLKTYMFDQFVQKFIINVSFKFPSTMCRSFWKIIIIRNIIMWLL